MDFLEDNQIREWATERAVQRVDDLGAQLPNLSSRGRRPYGRGGRSGREDAAAADLVAGLGSWDECLVWVRLWGVWPSSEDWPRYYAWRGRLGERRSLEVAPGHRFESGEVSQLTELLTLIMENAWDADIFCSRSGRADALRGKICHDEWYEILDAGHG
jgi:hypothetical protein